MNLSEFFPSDHIVRDGSFARTMFPRTQLPNSLCYAANLAFLKLAQGNPNVTSIITTPSLVEHIKRDCGTVAVDDPRHHYFHLHNRLVSSGVGLLELDHYVDSDTEIHPAAMIGHPVFIEKGVRIGPYSIVGDYTIVGAHTFVGDHVSLSVRGMQNTYLDGQRAFIAYAGGVRIGSRCEILTGAVIQKPYHAMFTEVGDDTVISVRVTVGHGSKIGRRVAVAGGVQISGNCRIGDSVRIGPLAVLSDDIEVGDGADIKLGSVIVENVPPQSSMSGNFAIPHTQQLRRYIKSKREGI